ncbi:MAG: hypothetical protein Q9169_005444 [Polycauliona sp. 2 TL-2023]
MRDVSSYVNHNGSKNTECLSLPERILAPAGTELQELQHTISSYLSNLYHLSVFIRRKPAPYDRLIKSANIDTRCYEFFDESYVRDKFPKADRQLVERLGKAISKRRKYFIYRAQHRQKLAQQQRPDQALSGRGPKGPVWKGDDGISVQGKTIQVARDTWAPSLVQSSVAKQSTTASTLFVSNIASLGVRTSDQQSDAGTQTSYGTTASSTRPDRLSLPPIPHSSEGHRQFECPYCFTICQVRASDPDQREKEWKRHLLADLQPYVCTFGNCSKKDSLFERRRDWISHELHSHRTEWYCNTPGHQAYGSKEIFQNHMRDEHKASFDEDQLESLAKMVARPAMELKYPCPLCCSDKPETFPIDKLEIHLGRHLEVIASFALPRNDPDHTSPTSTPDGSNVTRAAIHDTSSDSDVLSFSHGAEVASDVEEESLPDSLGQEHEDWGFLPLQAEPSGPLGEINALRQETHVDETDDWDDVDTQSHFLAAVQVSKHPGTTQWIVEHPTFIKFLEGKMNFLLFQGLPACGKTMLASTIIRSIQQYVRVTREPQSETGRKADWRDETPERLLQLRPADQQGLPSQHHSKLLEILQAEFSYFEETILIVDGLDFCTDETITAISRTVQKAMKQDLKVRLVAFSRISMVVEDAIADRDHDVSLGSRPSRAPDCVMISREAVTVDINVCILSGLASSGKPAHLTADQALLARAHARLVVDSKGIFIWVAALLKHLTTTKHRPPSNNSEGAQYVENLIRDRSEMVSSLWVGILERIPGSPEPKHTTAVRDTLSLLSVCERPLHAVELHEGLSYNPRKATWHNYVFSDQFGIWRHFPALLELVGQPGKNGNGRPTDNLGLVHPSLKEMLQSDSIRKGPLSHFAINSMDAQKDIAERCVSDLLRYSTSESYRSKYGWSAYAGTYWHIHVKNLGSNASHDLTARALRLLDPGMPSFAHWIYMTRRDGDLDTSEDGDFGKQDTYPSPLYYAALLGLHQCTEYLIENGAIVNVKGGKYEYPVVAAVVAGAEDIIELLATRSSTGIKASILDVSPVDVAALKAVVLCRAYMLTKLLESGVDISRCDQFDKTMAHTATEYDSLDCLRILFGFGASLEARDHAGMTPLQTASSTGATACMEFLLSMGANIHTRDAIGRTPLIVAASAGKNAAVVLLLEKGAPVDDYDHYYMTALCNASGRLDLTIVTSLLEAGADPNGLTNSGRPLHQAVNSKVDVAERSSLVRAVVERLLQCGADPSILGTDPSVPGEPSRLVEDMTADPELKQLLRSTKWQRRRKEAPYQASLSW